MADLIARGPWREQIVKHDQFLSTLTVLHSVFGRTISLIQDQQKHIKKAIIFFLPIRLNISTCLALQCNFLCFNHKAMRKSLKCSHQFVYINIIIAQEY